MRLISLAFPLAALLAACAGTTVSLPQGDAGGGGSPADGGCITPTEGAACTSGELACQPADPCCAGYEWTCGGAGTWQKAGLGCACQTPPPCGSATCAADEYCKDQAIPAPDGGSEPDQYTCQPAPASCAATPTCPCVAATLPSTCSCQEAAGRVTVHCQGI